MTLSFMDLLLPLNFLIRYCNVATYFTAPAVMPLMNWRDRMM
jgi:hypothetical protein